MVDSSIAPDEFKRSLATAERRASVAEMVLREGDTRHHLLIESWAQAVWEVDAEGIVVADSPSWRAYTGQTLDEWLGHGWLDAVHPDDRGYAKRQWQEAMAARSLVDAEFRLRAPDGEWRWTNVRAAPVLDQEGRVEKWAGMNIDIDARKRAEIVLRKSEERYRSLFNTISQGLAINQLVRDEHGRVVDARYLDLNPAYEAQTGFEHGRAVGRLASEIFPLSEPFWLEMAKRVVETGKAECIERFDSDTGRWFSLDMTPSEGNDQFVVLYENLTDRKQSEERQAFLLAFSDALRAETTADAVADRALKMLSQQLQLDRCYLANYLLEDDRAEITHQRGNGRLPPMPETIQLSDFPEAFRVVLDKTLVIDDVSVDERLSPTDRDNILSLSMRAILAPTLRQGPQRPLWVIVAASGHSTDQTFSLALHELVTNALKYGAFASPDGHLTVRWNVADADGGQSRLQVDWRESRVVMTHVEERPRGGGYGRELIERALPYQLGAKTIYELTPDGVHCTIDVPTSVVQPRME